MTPCGHSRRCRRRSGWGERRKLTYHRKADLRLCARYGYSDEPGKFSRAAVTIVPDRRKRVPQSYRGGESGTKSHGRLRRDVFAAASPQLEQTLSVGAAELFLLKCDL